MLHDVENERDTRIQELNYFSVCIPLLDYLPRRGARTPPLTRSKGVRTQKTRHSRVSSDTFSQGTKQVISIGLGVRSSPSFRTNRQGLFSVFFKKKCITLRMKLYQQLNTFEELSNVHLTCGTRAQLSEKVYVLLY